MTLFHPKIRHFNKITLYMEDVRQGHHGIHRVNPRNNERRTDNDHYADETNSMISDARNPGGETSGILDPCWNLHVVTADPRLPQAGGQASPRAEVLHV